MTETGCCRMHDGSRAVPERATGIRPIPFVTTPRNARVIFTTVAPRSQRTNQAQSGSSFSLHAFTPVPIDRQDHWRMPRLRRPHFVPLNRGGADHPSNMQWQTTEDAKQKDRVE
jgi:hypothetical protein